LLAEVDAEVALFAAFVAETAAAASLEEAELALEAALVEDVAALAALASAAA
jgi:hypothetical protein